MSEQEKLEYLKANFDLLDERDKSSILAIAQALLFAQGIMLKGSNQESEERRIGNSL